MNCEFILYYYKEAGLQLYNQKLAKAMLQMHQSETFIKLNAETKKTKQAHNSIS